MRDECACGLPLHYTNERTYEMVAQLCRELGENVSVVADQVTYSVQRHYIALHGLRADELPELLRAGTVKLFEDANG